MLAVNLIPQMASRSKRLRPEKGFFKTVEDGVPIKLQKLYTKPAKVDAKTFFPIEVSCWISLSYFVISDL